MHTSGAGRQVPLTSEQGATTMDELLTPDRSTPDRSTPDRSVLVGRLAADLAHGAPLADALSLLVEGWGLRSAALRCTAEPGELLAVAGDVVRAVPGQRHAAGPGARVELAVPGGGGHELAVLVVTGADPCLLPALRAAAAVLGLALTAAPVGAAPEPTGEPTVATGELIAVLTEADEDACALADRLHDGPVQTLVAARYACDAAVRGGDVVGARDAVQEALVALRRTLWHVRPRGAQGLSSALGALSERLVEAGHHPLVLALDATAADRLRGPARSAVFRLVQAVALADGIGPVRVALHGSGRDVLVDVDVGRALDVGSARDVGSALDGADRWRRRLRALGGDLSSSSGRLRLALPAPPDSISQPYSLSPPDGVSRPDVPAPRTTLRPTPLPVRLAAGSSHLTLPHTPEEACS